MNGTSEKSLQAARRGEAGFSIEQVVITLAVIAIVSGFAVMGLARSRATLRLTTATDEFTSYLEKTRADSMRRHATVDPTAPPAAPAADQMASITFASQTSYIVTMDFDSDGAVEADERRTVTLPDGVTFPADSITDPAKTVGFNWRGRPTEVVSISVSNAYGDKTVSVSESGSVAVGDTHDLDGFDVSGLEAPKDIPKSEFEGGSAEETDDGKGNGKDKTGGGGITIGGTTIGGGTTTGGGATTGGDTTGGTTTGGDTTTGGTTTGGDTTGGTTTDGGTTTGGTTTGGTTTGDTGTTTGNGNGNNGNGNNGNGNDKNNTTPTATPTPAPTPESCTCGRKTNGQCRRC